MIRLIICIGLLLVSQALGLAHRAITPLQWTDRFGRSWANGGVKTHHLLELNKSPKSNRYPSTYHYRVGLGKVRVYLIDRGINVEHDEFRDLRRRKAIRPLKQSKGGKPFEAGDSSHGLCMASLLAGTKYGAYPAVGSLTVADKGETEDNRDGHLFADIERDLDQFPSHDPVVISMSWGICDFFKRPGAPPDSSRRRSAPQADLYSRMQSLSAKYRVVYVVATGNMGTHDEQQVFCLPHRWGTKDDDLVPPFDWAPPESRQKPDTRELPGIVLVGAMESSQHNATYPYGGMDEYGRDRPLNAPYGDRHEYSAVMNPMLYAPSGTTCASHENNSATQDELGTSLSTPLTAGLLANLWDTQENINKNASEIIKVVRSMAWSRGTNPDVKTIWNGFEVPKSGRPQYKGLPIFTSTGAFLEWLKTLMGRG